MKKTKTRYVDGFVLVVPRSKVKEYKKMAKEGNSMWMKHGALAYRECMGNDLPTSMGGYPILSFRKMIKAKPHETVWYSYIEFKSKAHRDQVNKKVMAEMNKYAKEHPEHMDNMPFDVKRMAFGGFTVEVSG